MPWKPFNGTCGVYGVRSITTDRIYIGSSINIESRWVNIRNCLDLGIANLALQIDWNKYGKEDFIFEILEIVNSESNLLREQREQHYINLSTNPYNDKTVLPIKSGIRGITFKGGEGRRKPWRASITGYGHIGYYFSIEEAKNALDDFEQRRYQR